MMWLILYFLGCFMLIPIPPLILRTSSASFGIFAFAFFACSLCTHFHLYPAPDVVVDTAASDDDYNVDDDLEDITIVPNAAAKVAGVHYSHIVA